MSTAWSLAKCQQSELRVWFVESRCVLENAACKAAQNGSKLGMAYMGQCITVSTPCQVVLGQGCPNRIYSKTYVCGTDGRTYSESYVFLHYCYCIFNG